MITIHTKPEDLLHLRFAYSPLMELVMSFRALENPARHTLYLPWIKEAQQALRGSEFPYMEAVILAKHYIADFLTPTPTTSSRSLEDDFQRLRATPDWIIRKNVLEVIEFSEHSDIRQQFLDFPLETLECLIEEMRLYWRQTLARHWTNMVSVLEGDLLFRARQMALEGSDVLLANLNEIVHYYPQKHEVDTPKIEIHKVYKDLKGSSEQEFTLTGSGLQLVPSIFTGHIGWQISPEWRPMVIYRARGTGLWFQEEVENPADSLRVVLGESRARILYALATPVTPGELATRLNFTPGAISQHLGKLNQAGLVDSQRSGNRIFYSLSPRGEQMLTLFAD